MAKKDRLGADPLSWIGDSSKDSGASDKKSESKEQPQKAASTSPNPAESSTKETNKIDAVKSQQTASSKETTEKNEPVSVPKPSTPESVKTPAKPTANNSSQTEKKVDSNIQIASKALLQKNRDIKQDTRGSDVKKNLELEGKYLTFVLANEDYGIEITKVKEIMGLLPITRVPRTKHFIKGVINLRGKIVSVVDMRSKFSMDEIEATQETCIIVVQTKLGEKGIVVDRVSEVLNISADEIDSVPEFGTNIDTEYILGMAKIDASVKILLDIEKILSNLEKTIEAT